MLYPRYLSIYLSMYPFLSTYLQHCTYLVLYYLEDVDQLHRLSNCPKTLALSVAVLVKRSIFLSSTYSGRQDSYETLRGA